MGAWNKLVTFSWSTRGMIAGADYISMSLGSYSLSETIAPSLPRAHFTRGWGLSGGGDFSISPNEMGLPNKNEHYEGTLTVTIRDLKTGEQRDSRTSKVSMTVSNILDEDAEKLCPPNSSYDWVNKICRGVEPPEPKPPPPADDNGKPPPPVVDPKPEPPDSSNLVDWVKYLVNLVAWFIRNWQDVLVWVFTSAFVGLYNLIPEPIRLFLEAIPEGIINFFKGWYELFTDPRKFMLQVVNATFEEKSPSLFSVIGDQLSKNIANALKIVTDPKKGIKDEIDFYLDTARPYVSEMDRMIKQPVIYQDIENISGKFWKRGMDMAKNMAMGQTMIEVLSVGQIDRINEGYEVVNEIFGYQKGAATMRDLQLQSNLLRNWEYWLNEHYKNVIPSAGELIQMRRLELIEKKEFEQVLAKSGGINEKWAQLLYDSSLLPPTLDDFITHAIRQKEGKLDLKEVAAIANIDAERYLEIFEERRYNDLSLTMGRFMYEVGSIEEKDLEFIAKANKLRDKPLKGQKKSHAEMYKDWAMGFQTRIWFRQKLLAYRSAFVEGIKSEEDLKEAAGELLRNEEAIEAYIDAAKARKEVHESKLKRFTMQQLAIYRTYDSVDDEFIEKEIEEYKYDEEHQKVIADYTTKLIAEKKAQKEKYNIAAGEISYKLFSVAQLVDMKIRKTIDDKFIKEEINRMPFDKQHRDLMLKDIQLLIQAKQAKVES